MPKVSTFYCQTGKHKWTRPSKRGRPPVNCPEHNQAPVKISKPKDTEPALKKARKVRVDNAAERIWEEITFMRKSKACKCNLQKGMGWDALRDLGSGCGTFGVCGVLDAYRRKIGGPPSRPIASAIEITATGIVYSDEETEAFNHE